MHRRTHLNLAAVALAVMSALSISAAPAGAGYPGAPDLHPNLMRAVKSISKGQTRLQRASGGHQQGLSLVGFTNLGRPANNTFSSDVWAHGNFAYVGTFFDLNGGTAGVQVIDISDPRNPTLVNNLPVPEPFTGSNDIKVARIRTKQFKGDLLVVSNESGRGGNGGANGVQIWDVTDPLNAIELSRIPGLPVHNLFLYQKGERAFVALAVSFAEVFSPLFPPFVTIGDFILVEVTDPENPQIISDWGAGKDGGFPYGAPFPFGANIPASCDTLVCRGSSPFVNLHDVWVNKKGTIAYLSYWDLGLILLDISNPSEPKFIGRGIEPPALGSDEGNCHAAMPARNGNLVLVTDEDFEPGPWGFLRIYDTRDPENPVQISTYATDGTLNNMDDSEGRTIHNVVTRGNLAYISWYYEGIRVIDFSRPENPKEIASFLPPQGTGDGDFWGIYLHKTGASDDDDDDGDRVNRDDDDDDGNRGDDDDGNKDDDDDGNRDDDDDGNRDDDDDGNRDDDDDGDDRDAARHLILVSDITSGLYILELSGKDGKDGKDDDGPRSTLGNGRVAENSSAMSLEQNHPNPFNPTTVMRFSIPDAGHVSFVIYDAAGQAVRTLINEQFIAGGHAVEWNGRDNKGELVSSGVYFYRLTAAGKTITRKAVFLK